MSSHIVLRMRDVNMSVRTGHIFTKRKQVLRNINIDIRKGECVAYLGANGAGKTSTFKAISGLSSIDSGSIIKHGTLSIMPETPYFYKHITCRDLLSLMGKLNTVDDINQKIDAWSHRLNITPIMDKRIGQCSKGQVQRVGLAQVLMSEPDIVILDEPLSGLDPVGRRLVISVLLEQSMSGQTILFSSHIIDDVEKICTRAIFIRNGSIAHDEFVKREQYRTPPQTALEKVFMDVNQC